MLALRSIYRKSQFEEFGGREWQHILLALGDVDQEMVTIVNTIVQERTAASLLQQRGARAVPRVERTHQEVGINHRISDAKAARAHARQLDKIRTKEEAQYQQRTSTMSWGNWNNLLDAQKAVASTSNYTVNTTTLLLATPLLPHSYYYHYVLLLTICVTSIFLELGLLLQLPLLRYYYRYYFYYYYDYFYYYCYQHPPRRLQIIYDYCCYYYYYNYYSYYYRCHYY